MSNRRAGRTLRGNFLGSASRLGLAKAKIVFLPIVAGAAFAWGIGFDAEPARAAAGVCAPDASGTPAAPGPIESCSGDFATGISYPGAVGPAGSFEVDLNSITNVADGGVIVSSGGAVNLTITQFATAGNISNLSGNGIDVTNFGANIAITTVGGNVTASGIGINGEQLLAAGGGDVNVTLGNGGTITLNDGTANDASGIYAVAQDAGNLLTGNVAVTLNNSVANHTAITVTGDNNSAITARSEGGGSVAVNTGANNDLVVTGDTSFGIIATGLSSGSVNVTTGIGSDITVNAGNGIGAIYGFSAGIFAGGSGGNVDVSTGGNVTVNGFSAGTNSTVG